MTASHFGPLPAGKQLLKQKKRPNWALLLLITTYPYYNKY
jgi:hypothetical protein